MMMLTTNPYIAIPDALIPSLREAILEEAIARQAEYEPSTTRTQAEGYRCSKVLHNPSFEEGFLNVIRLWVIDACLQLRINRFAPSKIECQVTAHEDGGFYKRHTDNGAPGVESRILTYVYYCWREPKGFSGGTLKFEGHELRPENGMLLFFPSSLAHEVTPVSVPSKQWEDSRFTVNGWIRR